MATAVVVSKLMGGAIGGVDSEALGTFPSRCRLMPRVVLSLSAQHHCLEENVMPEDELLITDIVNEKLVCVLPYCLTTQSHLKIPKFDSVRLHFRRSASLSAQINDAPVGSLVAIVRVGVAAAEEVTKWVYLLAACVQRGGSTREVGWHAVGGGDGEGGDLRVQGMQPEWRWKGQGARAGGARESAEVSQANGGGEGVGAC